jgi:hypothetical protein
MINIPWLTEDKLGKKRVNADVICHVIISKMQSDNKVYEIRGVQFPFGVLSGG